MTTETQYSTPDLIQQSQSAADRVITLLNPLVAALGYEIVHVEIITARQKTLRVFIDFTETVEGRGIGIQDCVNVTKALDEPLDGIAEIDAMFKGPYELEVSSPGVDRPLRTAKDYQRFAGRNVRVHVYRPLNAEEIGNPEYQAKNPKQKNFLGKLVALEGQKLLLALDPQDGEKKKKPKKKSPTNSAAQVTIPMPLISKANLEPVFEFEG